MVVRLSKKLLLLLSAILITSCNLDYNTDDYIGTSFVYIGECPNFYSYIDATIACEKKKDSKSYACKRQKAMDKYVNNNSECYNQLFAEALVHGIAIIGILRR